MRLKFEEFDGRKSRWLDITDEVTGKVVGFINCNGTTSGNFGGMEVSLFDGKYRAYLHRAGECRGFVQGVEAVLNHMVHIKE